MRIARVVVHYEGIPIFIGNLTTVALRRRDWASAEALAYEALTLSEKVGRQEVIADNCLRMSQTLVRQGRKLEALPYARRAVEIFTALRSPQLEAARKTLAECES